MTPPPQLVEQQQEEEGRMKEGEECSVTVEVQEAPTTKEPEKNDNQIMSNVCSNSKSGSSTNNNNVKQEKLKNQI